LNLTDISKIVEDIIKSVYSDIKKANDHFRSNVIVQVPYFFGALIYYYQDNGMPIEELQQIIWGKIVKRLIDDNFICKINVDHTSEKVTLFIEWDSNLRKIKELAHYYNTEVLRKNKY
jgi:hypothetical protein